MKEVIEWLGRKPKNLAEYHKVWRFLFEGDVEESKKRMKKQRQRHMSHTGVANISRKFCVFCEQEK